MSIASAGFHSVGSRSDLPSWAMGGILEAREERGVNGREGVYGGMREPKGSSMSEETAEGFILFGLARAR